MFCFCFCVIRALCYLSVKQYREAVRDCGEALMIDGANIKALYRRAQAHKELKVRAAIFILQPLGLTQVGVSEECVEVSGQGERIKSGRLLDNG